MSLNKEYERIMGYNNSFVLECYGVSEDNMNKLIDIMIDFDCCLYDSSIDVRFE